MTGRLTLGDIADRLGVECRGDRQRSIRGLATLGSAGEDQLSFLANPRYAELLARTGAGAVLLAPEQAEHCPVDCLVTEEPYLAYARASHWFDRAPRPPARSEEHTSELQSRGHLVCRLLLEKKTAAT